MTNLRTRNESAGSVWSWSHAPESGSRHRFSLTLLLAIFIAGFVWPVHPAKADWFVPKLEATAIEDSIEVIVHVSATVGSSVLENHPLGTYHIPKDSKVKATLQAGIATFELTILTEGDIVFIIVDMITPNAPPQKRYSIVHLKR